MAVARVMAEVGGEVAAWGMAAVVLVAVAAWGWGAAGWVPWQAVLVSWVVVAAG